MPRSPSRQEQRAEAGRRKLQSRQKTLTEKPRRRVGRQLFAAVAWLGSWSLLTWAAADLAGPIAWKVGGALLLLAAAGVVPLWRIARGGLIEFPPWDWFKNIDA